MKPIDTAGILAFHNDSRRDPCGADVCVGELVALVEGCDARAKAVCGFLKGEGATREDIEDIGKF